MLLVFMLSLAEDQFWIIFILIELKLFDTMYITIIYVWILTQVPSSETEFGLQYLHINSTLFWITGKNVKTSG